MTATAPDQIAFMERNGMPLSTRCMISFTAVSQPTRLAYRTIVDFVPGLAPYHVHTVVDLSPVADGVKIVITFDAMHDDVWTGRARAGHESQIRKLDRQLAAPTQPAEASRS